MAAPRKNAPKSTASKADLQRDHLSSGPARRVFERNFQTCDSLADAVDCPVVGLPQSLYALQHSEFPLTDALADERFASEINYFALQVNGSVAGGDQSGNLIATSSPRAPFLAKSLCLVVWVDPWQASIAGSAQALPAAPTTTPVFTGAVPFGGVPRPATFRLGWDVLEAAQAYVASYRINMWLGGELKVVDELLRHVGTIESNNRAAGYGSSQRSITDWIKEANRKQRENGSTVSFLPLTAQVSGQVTEGILPPLVDMSVGSVVMEGAFGCCFPIRPTLMLPGQPIDVQLIREVGSDIDHDRLLRAAKFQAAGTTYDENWSETLTGNVGYAVDYQFKYGEMVIGLMYKGLQLTPRCCLDWYYNFGYWQSQSFADDVLQRKLELWSKSLGLKVPAPRDPRLGMPILTGFNPSDPKSMERLGSMFDESLVKNGKTFNTTGSAINPYECP